jgi:predicted transcriptional regulator
MMNTSAAAKRSIKGIAQKMREQILSYITVMGDYGCTCDEVEEALNLKHQTASARIKELMNDNLITLNGKQRLTRSKRKANVYIKNREDPKQLRLL